MNQDQGSTSTAMLNRPRPRKIVSVIKSSPSTESVKPEENETANFESDFKSQTTATPSTTAAAKPQSPVAPQFSNTPASTINPSVQNKPIGTSSYASIPAARKPIVATLKKAHVPPPPSFSHSPKSTPTTIPSKPVERSSSPPAVLSPKSSAESFLDAADKAADFIGGAFLNSFKSFNMNDTSTVKLSPSMEPKDDDDPFADIMKKLQSEKKPEVKDQSESKTEAKPHYPNMQAKSAPSFSNLMDEEPPKFYNEPEEITAKQQSPVLRPEETVAKQRSPVLLDETEIVKQVHCEPESMSEDKPIPNSYSSFENEVNSEIELIAPVEVITSPESSIPSQIDSHVAEPVNNCTESPIPVAVNSSVSSIPFLDSFTSVSSSNSDTSSVSSPNSFSLSPRSSGGFRASILKHGLSALEKIGKSTADVVVSTRNKLTEPNIISNPVLSPSHVVTPDYSDESSSFYDILKLYGGYAKLQELQLKGVRASISMKLARKNERNVVKSSSFDHQARLRQQREVAGLLHPDRIMDSIDDSTAKNLLFLASEQEFMTIFPILSKLSDEIYCIQKVLKSLEGILVIAGDEPVLIPSNRRRHVICQVSTVFCSLLQLSLLNNSGKDALSLAAEISLLTSQIIKYLQTNFARNCEDHPQVDRDQQLAIKLFLDIAYSIVPQLQNLILLQ